MTDSKKTVAILLKRASEAENADSAMKFSQAACNAANALCAFASVDMIEKQARGQGQ